MQYTPEEQAYISQQQAMPQQVQQQIPPGKDPDFMQWLFDLKEHTLTPLRHSWAGEMENADGTWELPKDPNDRMPIMNKKGIAWGCSQVGDYLNPVFIISNYDEAQMNWVMRDVGRVTWDGLSQQYLQFELAKINIPKVAWGIIHKIHAILLGARNEGYRRFFMSTHHVDEVKNTQVQQQPQKKGWGLFKKVQPIPPTNQMEMY